MAGERECQECGRRYMADGPVPILQRGDRGFHGYGEPFRDAYTAELEVYESSSAEGPHVWLSIEDMPVGEPPHTRPRVEVCAHLNPDMARALIGRLQAWLDEIPMRWK